jgi:hypothetical protein
VHVTIANMAQAPDGTWLTVAAGGSDFDVARPNDRQGHQALVRAFVHGAGHHVHPVAADRGAGLAQVPDNEIVCGCACRTASSHHVTPAKVLRKSAERIEPRPV